MDINEEMEQLLAEASGDADRKRSKAKKRNSEGTYLQTLVPPENLLKDQIEAALLAETLIDEIRLIENREQSEASKLMVQCEALEKHTQTLDGQKKILESRLTELSKDNDTLK